MGFATRLLAMDPPANPANGPLDDFWYKAVGPASATGLRITPDVAIQVSAVFACVKVLAETMGVLPMPVYERLGENQKRRAYEVSEYRLLNIAPNEWQTPYDLKENLTAWAALHGNGYAFKIFDASGAVAELDPVHPSLVRVEKLPARRLRYWVRQPDGLEKPHLQSEMFHLRGFSLDGVEGLKLSETARDAIGLARAMEAFGGRYFANDTTVGMVLEHPGKLSPEAHDRLRASFVANSGGVLNAFKPKVLEEGMKLNRLQAVAKDAQLTEGRLHQVIEICRFFRMPPHKIAHLIQATFSNIEHQAIEFVTDTIQPWAVRWEEAITRDIILDDTRYFAEALLAALLRGDSISRGQYLQMRMQNGTLSPNEWRALENENPRPGGDVYYVNAALLPLDAAGRPLQPQPAAPAAPDSPDPSPDPSADPTDPTDTADDTSEGSGDAAAADASVGAAPTRDATALARASFRVLLADAADRIAKAEARELTKRVDKVAEDHARYVRWAADEVYAGHLAYAARTLTPIAAAWDALGISRVDPAAVAAAIVAGGKARIATPAFRADPHGVIAQSHPDVARLILAAFTLEDESHAA